MLKKLNQQGVASTNEYVVTFFLVIVVVVAMTTYIQRTLQGRMRDARHYMIGAMSEKCDHDCKQATKLQDDLRIREEYEPYYVKVNSLVATDSLSHAGLLAPGVGSPGIFISRTDLQQLTNTQSDQLPPKDAAQDKLTVIEK